MATQPVDASAPRERLEDFERGRHVGADAAEAARPQQLEASRVDQLPEEIGRHSPRRLDLGARAAIVGASSWTASSTSSAVRVAVSIFVMSTLRSRVLL